MDKLTPKQEAFVSAYLKTRHATEAYKLAGYSVENKKPQTIWSRASELLKHGKVQARIAEAEKEARKAVKITLSEHLEQLQALRDGAKEAGQWGPAVKAEESRGKASGIYTAAEEDEREVRNMGRDEIIAELAELRALLDSYVGGDC